jgi:hypothetical protein
MASQGWTRGREPGTASGSTPSADLLVGSGSAEMPPREFERTPCRDPGRARSLKEAWTETPIPLNSAELESSRPQPIISGHNTTKGAIGKLQTEERRTLVAFQGHGADSIRSSPVFCYIQQGWPPESLPVSRVAGLGISKRPHVWAASAAYSRGGAEC